MTIIILVCWDVSTTVWWYQYFLLHWRWWQGIPPEGRYYKRPHPRKLQSLYSLLWQLKSSSIILSVKFMSKQQFYSLITTHVWNFLLCKIWEGNKSVFQCNIQLFQIHSLLQICIPLHSLHLFILYMNQSNLYFILCWTLVEEIQEAQYYTSHRTLV